MDPFEYISRYFWALCLGFSLINYLAARRRLNAKGLDAEESRNATRHLQRFVVITDLPWVIMGLGQIAGFTPTVWYYFRPQDLNPFVIAWLTYIFLAAIGYAVWILRMNGAQTMRDFELLSAAGISTRKPQSEKLIKWLAAIGPFFVLLWIFMVASMDVPVG